MGNFQQLLWVGTTLTAFSYMLRYAFVAQFFLWSILRFSFDIDDSKVNLIIQIRSLSISRLATVTMKSYQSKFKKTFSQNKLNEMLTVTVTNSNPNLAP